MSVSRPVQLHKAMKYRVDSKKLGDDTKVFLMQCFGCARKVYNLYVNLLYDQLEEAGYENGDLPDNLTFCEVKEFKKDYKYLKDVDSLALANAKINFENALNKYKNEYDHISYTKRAKRRADSGAEPLSFRGLKGMPKFHSKAHGDFSYTTNCQYPSSTNKLKQPTIRLRGNMLHLPKLKKGKDIPLIMHRPFPADAVIGNVTISMDNDGEIYAAIEYSYHLDMNVDIRDAVVNGDVTIIDKLNILGLDYSQEHLYVDNEGRKANYPHYYRKSEKKLGRMQRQLSHMVKGSNNYQKKLKEIQKLSKHIANQRRDYLHKVSRSLADEYDAIAVEDIDLRAMGGALSLGKNLHDCGFGTLREMISYKLEEKGSCLVKVDRWYASTKICSCCNTVNENVILGVSEWTCPKCGAVHKRDINAAINIRNEGKRIFEEYFREWLEEDKKSRDKAEAKHKARVNKKKVTAVA